MTRLGVAAALLPALALLLRGERLRAGAPAILSAERPRGWHGATRLGQWRRQDRPAPGRGGLPGLQRVAAPASLGLLLLAAAPAGAVAATRPRYVFEELDENEDGSVDLAEFFSHAHEGLDAAGEANKAWRKAMFEHVESLYHVADFDEDGVLSEVEVEYADYMSSTVAFTANKHGEALSLYLFSMDGSRDLLNDIDSNGDGVVDNEEFLAAVREDLVQWGWSESLAADPVILAWLLSECSPADRNLDGVLDAREVQYAGFLAFHSAVKQMADAMAKILDADGDDLISFEEVLSTLVTMPAGKPGRKMTLLEHIGERFAQADIDKNHHLDIKELRTLYRDVLLHVTYVEES